MVADALLAVKKLCARRCSVNRTVDVRITQFPHLAIGWGRPGLSKLTLAVVLDHREWLVVGMDCNKLMYASSASCDTIDATRFHR